jgi:molecular chaperone GrpE
MTKGGRSRQAEKGDPGATPAAVEAAPAEAGPAPESEAGAGTAEAAEAARLKDQLLRLQADFDNYRKRTLREKNGLFRQATETILGDLLIVADHIELALKHAAERETDESLVAGWRLIQDQLLNVLRKYGVEPFEATGGPFDPRLHEAVAHLPAGDLPEGHVVEQTRTGYLMGDALPAQVVVSSGPAVQEGPAEN